MDNQYNPAPNPLPPGYPPHNIPQKPIFPPVPDLPATVHQHPPPILPPQKEKKPLLEDPLVLGMIAVIIIALIAGAFIMFSNNQKTKDKKIKQQLSAVENCYQSAVSNLSQSKNSFTTYKDYWTSYNSQVNPCDQKFKQTYDKYDLAKSKSPQKIKKINNLIDCLKASFEETAGSSEIAIIDKTINKLEFCTKTP